MGRTVGRVFEDYKQKALGRTPLRYCFQIVPRAVDHLPRGAARCSVVWEKGDKISYTDPAEVDQATSCVEFQQVMRQNATIYMESNALLPKEYTFKVQSVSGTSSLLSSEPQWKTLAKAKLDLSQFCSTSTHEEKKEFILQLHPQGRLHLSIKSLWLRNLQHAVGSDSNEGSHTDISSMEGFGWSTPGARSYTSDDLGPFSDQSVGGSQNRELSFISQAEASCTDACAASDKSRPRRLSDPGNNSTSGVVAAAITSSSDVGGSSGSSRLGHRRSASAPFSGGSLLFEPIAEESDHQPEYRQPQRRLLAQSESAAAAPLAPARAAAAAGPGGHAPMGRAPITSVFNGFPCEPAVAPYPAPLAHAATAGPPVSSCSGLKQEAGAVDGISRTLSNHLPSWMWPYGRSAVKDMTTDDIMRAISSEGDVAKLQMLARGLLAERNDWRFKASQAYTCCQGRDQELAELKAQAKAMEEKCKVLESQVMQLRENYLLEELVNTKVQLAELDICTTRLKGQLKKEREHSRQLAAKHTKLQSKYERVLHDQNIAQQGEGQGWLPGAATAAGAAVARPAAAEAGLQSGRGAWDGKVLSGKGGSPASSVSASPERTSWGSFINFPRSS